MSESASNPTSPVAILPSPVSLRHQSPSDCTSRIPQPAVASSSTATTPTAATTNPIAAVPKLRRSLSLRMRPSSSFTSSFTTVPVATRNHVMTDLDIDNRAYSTPRSSSNLHASTDTTDNINCKSNIKRSPIGASCPAINRKHLANGVAGHDSSPTSISSHKQHREHGLVNNIQPLIQ